MDPPHGLKLHPQVELRLHKEDVSGLHNVEPLGAQLERHQQDVDFGAGLEGGQLALEVTPPLNHVVGDGVFSKTPGDLLQNLLPLQQVRKSTLEQDLTAGTSLSGLSVLRKLLY